MKTYMLTPDQAHELAKRAGYRRHLQGLRSYIHAWIDGEKRLGTDVAVYLTDNELFRSCMMGTARVGICSLSPKKTMRFLAQKGIQEVSHEGD